MDLVPIGGEDTVAYLSTTVTLSVDAGGRLTVVTELTGDSSTQVTVTQGPHHLAPARPGSTHATSTEITR